jgi:hypothetical protein
MTPDLGVSPSKSPVGGSASTGTLDVDHHSDDNSCPIVCSLLILFARGLLEGAEYAWALVWMSLLLCLDTFDWSEWGRC